MRKAGPGVRLGLGFKVWVQEDLRVRTCSLIRRDPLLFALYTTLYNPRAHVAASCKGGGGLYSRPIYLPMDQPVSVYRVYQEDLNGLRALGWESFGL